MGVGKVDEMDGVDEFIIYYLLKNNKILKICPLFQLYCKRQNAPILTYLYFDTRYKVTRSCHNRNSAHRSACIQISEKTLKSFPTLKNRKISKIRSELRKYDVPTMWPKIGKSIAHSQLLDTDQPIEALVLNMIL